MLETCLSERKKEKYVLKVKLLVQRLAIQHTGIRTLDISSNMFYKNYYETTILAYKKIYEIFELYYILGFFIPKNYCFYKASSELVYELFTYRYLNFRYQA